MKILIVLQNMGQKKGKPGGVGNASNEIQKALNKKGHEVDILSREDNLKIYSALGSIFPLRKKIRQLMKKEKYDVIYTQDWGMTLPMLLPYRIFKKQHFVCFCGRQENIFIIIQDLVGKIMGKRLVVIGDRLKKAFPKATLIYRGVNFKWFKPLRKKRDSIGFVDKPSELITKEELKEIATRTGLKPITAKNIPINKMNEKFYSKCKVFISLPPQAGYNNVWNEAMASGAPIVIGNDRGAGTMLPFDKVNKGENRVEKITKIVKNPKKINYRKWLIDNGFSWKENANKLLRYFKKNV
ncbi:glycosyltransferase [Nanoarchaeota archaeon]